MVVGAVLVGYASFFLQHGLGSSLFSNGVCMYVCILQTFNVEVILFEFALCLVLFVSRC